MKVRIVSPNVSVIVVADVTSTPFKEIVVKEKFFESDGQEKTAFRFTTDKNGDILDVNELPANLVNSLGE